MKKEKIFVTEPLLPSYNEYSKYLKKIWANKWLTNNGEFHQQFEYELKQKLEVSNVSLFCNGHMALYTALNSLDLKGEVITTPFTFSSTTHAIVQAGLTPVFCDIDPNTYVIDANKIESLITDKTCAIVAVHVYGHFCDVKRIEIIAKKYNLKVIYDAAHAFGEKIYDKSIASYGNITMFSFHATKVFNTIEGGALCYNDESLKEKIEIFKNFGIKNAEEIDIVGINAKMNEFSAAMGLCNLKIVDKEIMKRKKIVLKYLKLLKDCNGIQLPVYGDDDGEFRNYSYFPILIDKSKCGFSRDDLFEYLKSKNILVRKYFFPLITELKCYEGNYDSKNTPIALDISNKILTLPLYGSLSLEKVSFICSTILEYVYKKSIMIDVYMITYNHKKYIEQAIDSILKQKINVKYRILIADDCSTDGTVDILKKYKRKYPELINLYLRDRNVGMRENARLLRQELQAPYIASLEGDDYWINDQKLQIQYDFLKSHEEYSAYASSVYIIDKNNQRNLDLERCYSNYCYEKDKNFIFFDALEYKLPGQTASLMCRNLYKDLTSIQKEAYDDCRANGDQKLAILNTLNEKKIYCSKVNLAAHRKIFDQGDSWSSKTKDKNMSKFHFDAICDIEKLLFEQFNLKVKMDSALMARFDDALNIYLSNSSKVNKKILFYIFCNNRHKIKMLQKFFNRKMLNK